MKPGIISVVVAGVLATAGLAAADHSTTVFPLTGSGLPEKLADAPEKMTTALVNAIGASAGNVPIEDAAGLLACNVESTKCLEAVTTSVKAKRVVFGTVTRADTGLKVNLTRFDLGPERVQQSYTLTGDNVDVLAGQLVTVSAPLFGATPDPAPPLEPAQVVAEPPANPTLPDDPIGLPPPPEGAKRGPSISTWIMIGGGVAIAGVGGGFLLSANGLREDVENAPRDTEQDFERLVALEDKGRFRTRLGYALVGAGGAVAVFGIVRAILQRDRPARDRSALHIQPVPIEGGAAVVLTVGAP